MSWFESNNDGKKESYEGVFAHKPNKVENGPFGSREVHKTMFGPDVHVTKDVLGNVEKVERRYFDW